MRITNLKENNEELNLDVDGSLDTPIYRDAYRELIKSKSCRNISYDKFLCRMKERNINSRKKEFERRKIVLDPVRDKIIVDAIDETLAAVAAINTVNNGKK